MKKTRLCSILILMICALMLFASCAFLQPSPSVCEKPEAGKSVICDLSAKLGLTPEKVGLILRLASSAALDKNPNEAQKALTYLDEALALLNEAGLSYNLFAKHFKKSPSMFVDILAGELLSEMGSLDMVIDPFDLNLIKTHLTRQKRIVQLSLDRSK